MGGQEKRLEEGKGSGGAAPAFGYVVMILRISLESDLAPAIYAFEVESGSKRVKTGRSNRSLHSTHL
jgi:hypothetical protein